MKFIFSVVPKHEPKFSISLSNDRFFGEDERVSSIFRLRDFDENATDKDSIDESSEKALVFGQNLFFCLNKLFAKV